MARWAGNGRRLFNTYGPTEATVVATVAEMSAGEPVTMISIERDVYARD